MGIKKKIRKLYKRKKSDDLGAPSVSVGNFFQRIGDSDARNPWSLFTHKTMESSSTDSFLGDDNHLSDPLLEEEVEEEEEEDVDLDRTTVRLDGLEAYAVVSALTSATSIQCFESFNFTSYTQLWSSGSYFGLIEDSVFIAAGATGILAGLHATLVFSLMTAYGRTAVGMERDDALDTFFSKTGLQRYRGFQTFLYSMKTFLIQVFVMIDKKLPPEIRWICFLGLSYILWKVYCDTDAIIKEAGVIFAPVAAPPPLPPAEATRISINSEISNQTGVSFAEDGPTQKVVPPNKQRKAPIKRGKSSFLLPAKAVQPSALETPQPPSQPKAPARRRESFQRSKSLILQPAVPSRILEDSTEFQPASIDSFQVETFVTRNSMPVREGGLQRRESFKRSKSSFMRPATECMTSEE